MNIFTNLYFSATAVIHLCCSLVFNTSYGLLSHDTNFRSVKMSYEDFLTIYMYLHIKSSIK